jgi:hypothetical protein
LGLLICGREQPIKGRLYFLCPSRQQILYVDQHLFDHT